MRLLDDHERACDGFTAITVQVRDDRWDAPTPCTEWDARAVGPEVRVGPASTEARLLGCYGRDPEWRPPCRGATGSISP